MDITLHLARPPEEAPEVLALTPHELPEFQKTDLFHLDAGVGFDSPKEIWASPGSKAVAFRRIPKKTNLVAHTGMIPTKVIIRPYLPVGVKHEGKNPRCAIRQTAASTLP
jgi:hypothetical protein